MNSRGWFSIKWKPIEETGLDRNYGMNLSKNRLTWGGVDLILNGTMARKTPFSHVRRSLNNEPNQKKS